MFIYVLKVVRHPTDYYMYGVIHKRSFSCCVVLVGVCTASIINLIMISTTDCIYEVVKMFHLFHKYLFLLFIIFLKLVLFLSNNVIQVLKKQLFRKLHEINNIPFDFLLIIPTVVCKGIKN